MQAEKSYLRAQQRIDEVRKSGEVRLDLSAEDVSGAGILAELPESLSELTQLEYLNLSGNRLTALPEWIERLAHLRNLDLSGNQFKTLPKCLGDLARLEDLNLTECHLGEVPLIIRHLKNLKNLNLDKNGLRTVPDWISELVSLNELYFSGNNLVHLPDSIGDLLDLSLIAFGGPPGGNPLKQIPDFVRRLKKLETLWAVNCEITSLPVWLLELKSLNRLYLEGNHLDVELLAAGREGFNAVMRYLRELEKGGRNRYEAKLLILGDGNEGKTCVSRALRGLPFSDQSTTYGVDVEQWRFPHPDDVTSHEKEITLNIWDFEGQEISHQTHQFFLTSQALYLLVFKCRDQFLLDRAEYWLDTIRARAPMAKVAIVISQCEERSPHVPQDKIAAQYGDMLAKEWFFPIGCKDGKNIDKLHAFLKRSAADLEFMGTPWPRSYDKAEVAIKKKADAKMAHLSRATLNQILLQSGVSVDNYDGAAGAMARIGAITQFPDSPDLSDFVVLKPQWLTKAISKVMEDAKLTDDKGEIEMKRMAAIWKREGYRADVTSPNWARRSESFWDQERTRDDERKATHSIANLRIMRLILGCSF